LPTRHGLPDPYEKPGRYSSSRKDSSTSNTGILENLKNAWMAQSPRSRYLKTGGLIFFVVFLFYYLAPGGVDVAHGGKNTSQEVLIVPTDKISLKEFKGDSLQQILY